MATGGKVEYVSVEFEVGEGLWLGTVRLPLTLWQDACEAARRGEYDAYPVRAVVSKVRTHVLHRGYDKKDPGTMAWQVGAHHHLKLVMTS